MNSSNNTKSRTNLDLKIKKNILIYNFFRSLAFLFACSDKEKTPLANIDIHSNKDFRKVFKKLAIIVEKLEEIEEIFQGDKEALPIEVAKVLATIYTKVREQKLTAESCFQLLNDEFCIPKRDAPKLNRKLLVFLKEQERTDHLHKQWVEKIENLKKGEILNSEEYDEWIFDYLRNIFREHLAIDHKTVATLRGPIEAACTKIRHLLFELGTGRRSMFDKKKKEKAILEKKMALDLAFQQNTPLKTMLRLVANLTEKDRDEIYKMTLKKINTNRNKKPKNNTANESSNRDNWIIFFMSLLSINVTSINEK